MTDEQKIVIIMSPPGTTTAQREAMTCDARRCLPVGTFVLVLPPGFDTADPPRAALKAAGDEIRAIISEHRLNPASAVYELGELAERLGSIPGYDLTPPARLG